MAAKKSAEVIIDGKVYTLSGYEEEDYLRIPEVRFLPSILQTIILRQRNLSTNIRWI